MARFTEKIGKIVRNMDEADNAVRGKRDFCTPLIKSMMDGTSGRRMIGRWETTYHPDDTSTRRYVVYSYADWWPLFVYDEEAQCWVGNKSKYSRTTTKHQRKVQPSNVLHWVDVETLAQIRNEGVVGWVRNKMQTAS